MASTSWQDYHFRYDKEINIPRHSFAIVLLCMPSGHALMIVKEHLHIPGDHHSITLTLPPGFSL